jgi:hypothetical protein
VLLAFSFPLILANKKGAEFLLQDGGWAIWVAILLCAPLINALNFLLANALFLLFPAWYQVDAANAQGIARVGQGLIQMLFQSILMMVVLVPTSAVLLAFGIAGMRVFDAPWAALAGVLPAMVLLAAAVWFFTEAVGQDFEEFDIAKELR